MNWESRSFRAERFKLTHEPYAPTPRSQDWNPAAKREAAGAKPEHFKDMVEYMDSLVGALVAQLDELGLRERTLIVFLGDNGTGAGTVSMMGERRVLGGKGHTNDYGTHVPLIVSWPGKAKAGTVCDDMVDATDLLPTLCAVASVPIPSGMVLDGRSFWPQCAGEAGNPRDWWYCWYAPYDEMVGEFASSSRLKLYRDGRVFRVAQDPGDEHPLRREDLGGPDAAELGRLQQALDRYEHARPTELGTPPAAGHGKRGEQE